MSPTVRSAVALGLALAAAAVAAQDAGAPRAPSFNPRISLILQGTYADLGSGLPAAVRGVLLGPETELRPEGLSLAETELVAEANVDDRFHGWVSVALENEDGETVVAVEEAYVDTLALPAGLAVKAGRFFSDIGYQNRIHSHAWDFADPPLAYRALLANQLKDDGVQLRWVAPASLLVELGAEALRGAQHPGGGDVRDGVNAWTGFLHLGGDLGVSTAWQVGVSHLDTDADGRETGDDPAAPDFTLFTGDSRLWIVDAVLKWARDGNPAKQNLVLVAEAFHRDETGRLVFDPAGAAVGSAYDGTQRGFYAQLVVQPLARWRVGLRFDQLRGDNAVATPAPGTAQPVLSDGGTARRATAMVDFSNSEFSRLRLQFSRDESRPGGLVDDQWILQYVMSLGAHPAHQF